MSVLLVRRTIILSGEIDAEMSSGLLEKLEELSQKSKAPIKLYINSGGGSVDDAFVMYDALRACRCIIHGIATGACWSSAVLVLQGCDTRLVSPNTTLMVHAGTIAVGESSPIEGRTSALAYYKDQKRFSDCVRARTNVSAKQFDKWCVRAKYLSPEECLHWGFIDGIFEKEKR